LGDTRALLDDGKVWLRRAIVTQVQGTSSHFRYDDGDIIVSVELQPDEVPVQAVLGPMNGSAGIFIIPDEGDEVLVALVDDGEISGEVYLIGLFDQQAPAGMEPRKVYIRGPEVLVFQDDPTNAKKLVTFDEFMNHNHPGQGVDPPTAINPTPALTGTSKLKGE
jgi:hypothetical protein